MKPALTSSVVSTVQKEKESLEAAVFKLKLQWIMAKDENEKRRISEEIRRRVGSTPPK